MSDALSLGISMVGVLVMMLWMLMSRTEGLRGHLLLLAKHYAVPVSIFTMALMVNAVYLMWLLVGKNTLASTGGKLARAARDLEAGNLRVKLEKRRA